MLLSRHTRRRAFILALGAATAWPLGTRAQPAKVSRLGVLLFSTPQADPQMETARRALRDLGYVEGQNLSIEYRYAEGHPERLPDLAADVQLRFVASLVTLYAFAKRE